MTVSLKTLHACFLLSGFGARNRDLLFQRCSSESRRHLLKVVDISPVAVYFIDYACSPKSASAGVLQVQVLFEVILSLSFARCLFTKPCIVFNSQVGFIPFFRWRVLCSTLRKNPSDPHTTIFGGFLTLPRFGCFRWQCTAFYLRQRFTEESEMDVIPTKAS